VATRMPLGKVVVCVVEGTLVDNRLAEARRPRWRIDDDLCIARCAVEVKRPRRIQGTRRLGANM
jgi:hypothetical protein